MGANKSKPTIETDNQILFAGESIHGSVSIAIPVSQASFSLTLRLEQKEMVTFLTGGEADWHSNTNDSCVAEQVLHSRSSIDAGFYQFPFEVKTPSTLSGSTQTCDNNHKASISHKLICIAQGPKQSTHSSLDITIKQNLPLIKSQSSACKAEIKYFNTFARGKSELHVDLAKTNYEVGEIVNLQVTVDNSDSEIPLKHIEVKLIRNVKFEYQTGRWEERQQKVFQYKYPVVVPSSTGLANFKSFSFAFVMNPKEKYMSGCGTAFGKIVETRFYFEVSGVFGKFLNDLKTCVPVVVYPGGKQDKVYEKMGK